VSIDNINARPIIAAGRRNKTIYAALKLSIVSPSDNIFPIVQKVNKFPGIAIDYEFVYIFRQIIIHYCKLNYRESVFIMPKLATVLGIILILLGLIAYFGLSAESITALIPTFFGVPFLILGFLGQKENLRKHAMHAAAALALIGFLGTAQGLFQFISMIGGTHVERSEAVTVQAIMSVLCLLFVILAVKSFIDARKAQKTSV